MDIVKKKGLTIFDLKILGITLMFVDHVHQMFSLMGTPGWLDWFGRPVATLFFFVSVEGFSHTRNKEKYLFRLLIGFWVMTVVSPIIQRIFNLGDMALANNIFTDLFVGVLAMYGIDCFINFKKTKKMKSLWLGLAAILLPIIFSLIILKGLTSMNIFLIFVGRIFPPVVLAENSIMVYLIPVMYLLRKDKRWQCLAIAIVAALFFFKNPSAAFTTNTQWMMIFSIIPIMLYNGEKGKSMRSFFYIFYPAHIWILYIIASLIYNH